VPRTRLVARHEIAHGRDVRQPPKCFGKSTTPVAPPET
jgi:hypothetical protein